MRSGIFVAVIVLHSLSAAGVEPKTDPGTVVLGATRVQVVPTIRQLQLWCTPDGDFDACTRFIAFHLQATCVRGGDSWNIRASATFTPWILLRNVRKLAHEEDHIGDVGRSVREYVRALEARDFSSAEQCTEVALHETAAFGDQMRAFAITSNVTRHALLRAAMRR